jgi:hypothetical protein
MASPASPEISVSYTQIVDFFPSKQLPLVGACHRRAVPCLKIASCHVDESTQLALANPAHKASSRGEEPWLSEPLHVRKSQRSWLSQIPYHKASSRGEEPWRSEPLHVRKSQRSWLWST